MQEEQRNKPIGVFDSGLGGLTVVKELIRLLPHEDIVYFGDTGRVPYGNRSRETIREYARQDIAFLRRQDVKMILAACGTVSSVVPELAYEVPVPYTGVLGPAAAAAVRATQNGRIGVIGTTATIKSGAYTTQIHKLNPHAQIFSVDCPLFVPLIENGWFSPEDTVTTLTAQRYLLPLREEGIDTLILGCTHYPILYPILQDILGDGITLIDIGRETALHGREILEEAGLLRQEGEGARKYYVSDNVEGFSTLAGVFLQQNIHAHVELISV